MEKSTLATFLRQSLKSEVLRATLIKNAGVGYTPAFLLQMHNPVQYHMCDHVAIFFPTQGSIGAKPQINPIQNTKGK